MKVYVDEFPKSCLDCPCCALSKSKPEYINECDYIYCNPLKQGMKWKPNERLKLKDCPLKPLSVALAEERKRVVQEIRKKLPMYIYNFQEPDVPRTKVIEYSDVEYILDQIDNNKKESN